MLGYIIIYILGIHTLVGRGLRTIYTGRTRTCLCVLWRTHSHFLPLISRTPSLLFLPNLILLFSSLNQTLSSRFVARFHTTLICFYGSIYLLSPAEPCKSSKELLPPFSLPLCRHLDEGVLEELGCLSASLFF